MKKGFEYEFEIIDTEFPGTGVAVDGERKVYIKNGLPGQKVKARVSKKKTEYAEAKITEIIEDVDYKTSAPCPVFGMCGGCTTQDVPYEKQLEIKKHQVEKLFNENLMDVLDPEEIEAVRNMEIQGSPDLWEYRNKMEFSFGDMEKGGELTLGMHVRNKAFGIVTVDNCKIVDGDFRSILSTVLNYFREKNLPYYRIMKREGYLRNLVVRKARNTEEIMVNIVTTSQMDFDMSEICEMLKGLQYQGKLTGVLHTINDSLADMVQADEVRVLYGQDFITEDLLGLKFKISPFSFFQTNSRGAEKLYSIVKDLMGDSDDKVVFDLYCGTGTIGQIVAPRAKEVTGVELIEEAVDAANENAKLNGLSNCNFIAGDVAEVIKTVKSKPDIIILDPPRPGVHPKAMEYVIKFNAPEIIYVSCNPKSLVNDLKVLKENGYSFDKVVLKDMFPHTPHVETVVRLARSKATK